MSNIELNEKQILLVTEALKRSCSHWGHESVIEPCVCVEKENKIFDLIWETSGLSLLNSKRFYFYLVNHEDENEDELNALYFEIIVRNKFSSEELFDIIGVFDRGDTVIYYFTNKLKGFFIGPDIYHINSFWIVQLIYWMKRHHNAEADGGLTSYAGSSGEVRPEKLDIARRQITRLEIELN